MFNKITKTAFVNTKSSHVLYQKVDSLLGIPFTSENVASFKLRKAEVLTLDEVAKLESLTSNQAYGEYVASMLNAKSTEDEFGVIEPIIEFLHSKRFFFFTDLKGAKKFVGIPSLRVVTSNTRLDSFSKSLLNVAKAYSNFLAVRTSENEVEEFAHFTYRVKKLQESIAKRLLSKNFKNKFQFDFIGLSGVALTGNLSYDGVAIPEWYAIEKNLKIGDSCVITRDPIQNIFLTLKIEAFTSNEIRVNSQTITLVDGDFDGDKLQVIPFCNILKECDRLGVNDSAKANIVAELEALLPTVILESEKFSRLVRDYSL
ncbi:MAG: hypothetical protein ACRC0G_02955 [Fusobacteriaceae bacterium]